MLFMPPPVEISLRPYQADAVERLRGGIRDGLRRQILVAPTGAGKTEMAMDIIAASQKKGASAWFIVDRINLIDQTSERFFRYGIDHSVIQAKHFLTDLRKPIQIISAQTLAKRKIEGSPNLIVWDECHAKSAGVKELVERAHKAKVIGLTATPFTAGMADDWDGLVNSTTVNQLIEDKFLSPLRIKACVAPDMKDAKRQRNGEYDDDESGSRGITIIGDVVATWIEQTQKHFGRPVKTLVFSPSVKHGKELCRQFSDAGYNFQQISYLDESADARAKVAEFRKPDTAIDGLVSCAVLTRGFDVPDVLCGISCRPYTKSFSSHIQEMGRVMRIHPGKEFGLWLDHSSNCISFADDTAWLFEYGVESLSDAAKRDSKVREPEEVVRKKRFCGSCGMQIAIGADTCPSCGWERPQRGEITFLQGELVDIEISTREAYKPRAGLHADCLKDPRAIWAAALAYCSANGRGGQDASRKWAYGVWRGIYPSSKLPEGLYDAGADHSKVRTDAWSLVEREVKRYRKTHRRAA